MENIPVDLNLPGVTCWVTLPGPLSSLMREGVDYDWAGLARIRMAGEDLLAAETSQENPDQLKGLLECLQTGLLYASVAGMRLREGAPEGPPDLSGLGRRVDLVGAGGRVASLAIWGGTTLQQVLGAARSGALAHFVLIRGPSRTLPRMSVLVGQGEAETALEEISRLRSLRVEPPLLEMAPDPEQEAALIARNRQLLEEAQARRKRAPNRPRKRRRLGQAEAGWELPFLPVLLSGSDLSPPALELDRIAVELCDSLRLDTTPELGRKRVLRALNRAWRLGEGPDRDGEGRGRNPQPKIVDFLRERSRVIEAVTRADATGRELRALTRISALQAWRFGAVHPRRAPVPPPPRFREERSVAARSVPQAALEALLALSESDAQPEETFRTALVLSGLMQAGEEPRLTDAGQAIVRELTSPQDDTLPSLRDLLEPTPEAVRALEPDDRVPRMGRPPKGRKGRGAGRPASPASKGTDPALRGLLMGRAEAVSKARVRADTDPMRELLFDLLSRAWRTGRDRRSKLPEGGHVRLPGPIRLFLEERSELISSLAGLRDGRHSKALKLIRASTLEAWQIGAGPDPDAAPAPRYLEESPAPLRGLSSSAREVVRALGLGQEVEIGKRTQNELRRAGLLSGEAPAGLTPQGEAAARADRDHRSSGLPSISGAPSRRRSRPE